jgi:hypothetical protein
VLARHFVVHQPLIPKSVSHLDLGHAVHESTELSFPEVLAYMTNVSGNFLLRNIESDATLPFPSSHHALA